MLEVELAACLRKIPAINQVLTYPGMAELAEKYGRERLLQEIQRHLAELRQAIIAAGPLVAGDKVDLSFAGICVAVREALAKADQARLRPVFNATGVVLHTNLGRAPLAPEALAAIEAVAGGYCNLELNLNTGKRGRRYDHVRELLQILTGADDALVVNNNAAAVLLILTVLAREHQVIVSRGELVEIGGAFRIPDVMALSGAQLVEVGTTNKTRLADYAAAIGENTRLLMKVHPSNFRIVGFTAAVAREELVSLARQRGLLVVEDLGSGVLYEQSGSGDFWGEPSVQSVVRAGIDLVTFSGDKLLGGPQSGIIVGRRDLIAQLAGHPLNRALRVDKLTLAALEATLQLYRHPQQVVSHIPTLSFLLQPAGRIEARAREVAQILTETHPAWQIQVQPGMSQVGGGALPEVELPSWCVVVRPPQGGAHALAERLRTGEVPVLGRVVTDALWLDLRTIPPPKLAEFTRLVVMAMAPG
ncbi:MAG: L-seryl-tRNA(Sec) selenium transferase [Heliobacteriaceae bacterium]|nr:L-seryl-tRNA(Sec) selenium transferase [Heliobacteriaceae bacterium]MDD4586814.1 L-seryl-tRNA(Sec) selenium transferase [Heliobacteriaceae bacterium]